MALLGMLRPRPPSPPAVPSVSPAVHGPGGTGGLFWQLWVAVMRGREAKGGCGLGSALEEEDWRSFPPPPAARPLLEEALRPGAVSEALEALQAGRGVRKGEHRYAGRGEPSGQERPAALPLSLSTRVCTRASTLTPTLAEAQRSSYVEFREKMTIETTLRLVPPPPACQPASLRC